MLSLVKAQAKVHVDSGRSSAGAHALGSPVAFWRLALVRRASPKMEPRTVGLLWARLELGCSQA